MLHGGSGFDQASIRPSGKGGDRATVAPVGVHVSLQLRLVARGGSAGLGVLQRRGRRPAVPPPTPARQQGAGLRRQQRPHLVLRRSTRRPLCRPPLPRGGRPSPRPCGDCDAVGDVTRPMLDRAARGMHVSPHALPVPVPCTVLSANFERIWGRFTGAEHQTSVEI